MTHFQNKCPLSHIIRGSHLNYLELVTQNEDDIMPICRFDLYFTKTRHGTTVSQSAQIKNKKKLRLEEIVFLLACLQSIYV